MFCFSVFIICRINSNAMSATRITYTMLIMCLMLCIVLNCNAGPTTRRPAKLTYEQREELYWNTPPVPDERLADAELDNAYEIYKWNSTARRRGS